MSVLGYDTGARWEGGEGGEVLGKLLASRQTPFIGLYQSQLRRASPSASHTGGVAEGGSITEQHLASITQHHRITHSTLYRLAFIRVTPQAPASHT